MIARARHMLGLVVLALGPVAPCAAAGLRWEVRERSLAATAGDAPVVTTFPFVNSGKTPVSIVRVETGCVCTVVKPHKSVYAPGEAGELTLEFVIGGRVGRQDRAFVVVTDEPGARPQELRLIVEIAELVILRSRVLFWAVGDPLAAKPATIQLVRPAQTTLQPPTCSNPGFTARLAPTNRPEIFELQVTPAGTSTPVSGTVRVNAVIDGKTHELTVFVAVR